MAGDIICEGCARAAGRAVDRRGEFAAGPGEVAPLVVLDHRAGRLPRDGRRGHVVHAVGDGHGQRRECAGSADAVIAGDREDGRAVSRDHAALEIHGVARGRGHGLVGAVQDDVGPRAQLADRDFVERNAHAAGDVEQAHVVVGRVVEVLLIRRPVGGRDVNRVVRHPGDAVRGKLDLVIHIGCAAGGQTRIDETERADAFGDGTAPNVLAAGGAAHARALDIVGVGVVDDRVVHFPPVLHVFPVGGFLRPRVEVLRAQEDGVVHADVVDQEVLRRLGGLREALNNDVVEGDVAHGLYVHEPRADHVLGDGVRVSGARRRQGRDVRDGRPSLCRCLGLDTEYVVGISAGSHASQPE